MRFLGLFWLAALVACSSPAPQGDDSSTDSSGSTSEDGGDGTTGEVCTELHAPCSDDCCEGLECRSEGGESRCQEPATTCGEQCDVCASDGDCCDGLGCFDGYCNEGANGVDCEHEDGPCSLWPQNCGDGQKCTAASNQADVCVEYVECVDITGDKQIGESCTRQAGGDDCAPGLFCKHDTSDSSWLGQGICYQYCYEDDADACADAGPDGGTCEAVCGDELNYCDPKCDPLAQDCPGETNCYGGGDPFHCKEPNYEWGDGEDGSFCAGSNYCKPGLWCEGGNKLDDCNENTCCTPICQCDPDMPNGIDAPECSGNEKCLCWWWAHGQDPGNYEDVGYCRHPV